MRAASKVSRVGVRVPAFRATPVALNAQRAFSQSAVRKSDAHAEETFEEFTARYEEHVERLGRLGSDSGTTDDGEPLGPIDCIKSCSADFCVLTAGMRRNSRRSMTFSSFRYVLSYPSTWPAPVSPVMHRASWSIVVQEDSALTSHSET